MKIKLDNEKEIEYLVNWNLGVLNIFKNDYNFEEITKSLNSIPAELKDRNFFSQKNETWTLANIEHLQGLVREKMVIIEKKLIM